MAMNEIERKPSVEVMHRTATGFVDEGLREHLIKVFNYMWISLCVTAFAAYAVANTGLLQYMYSINPQAHTAGFSLIGWLVILSPLALIFAFNYVLQTKSFAAAQTLFWTFAVMEGASLSSIFVLYTAASLTRVFLITAATFAAMSLYGYTTKRDLSKIGSFLFMGLIGLIIASIVNIFMQSPALYYALSYIGVGIFVGLTAVDMQNIKNLYYASDSSDTASRKALAGAMNLYLDFINLFISLLRIMGDRR